MRKLSPPLSVIESNLFDPSLALIRRWTEADPSLSPADLTALAADETARAMRKDWEAEATPEDAPDPPSGAPLPTPALPPHLAEKVQRRVATIARGFSTAPHPGLIVRVEGVQGAEGPLGADMAHPFAVLLSEPSEHPQVWYGWLMAAETDYAGPWDLLLERGDEPYDPDAAMVQTWNPVHLDLKSASRPLGELSPARLAAVRDLANDHGEQDPREADPGTLVQRTTPHGHLVLTGSPLGGVDDPRWRYQTLYYEAAGFVRAMAREALKALAPQTARDEAAADQPTFWDLVLGGLKAAARSAGMVLEPALVLALGPDTPPAVAEQPQRLGDLVEIGLIASPNGDALQLHLTLLRDAPLRVGLARDGRVRQEKRLTRTDPKADLFLSPDQGLSLFIRNDQGQDLFSCQVPDV